MAKLRFPSPESPAATAAVFALSLGGGWLLSGTSLAGAASFGDISLSGALSLPNSAAVLAGALIRCVMTGSVGKAMVKLAAMALLFTALLSIPLGVLSAARKGGFADKSIYLFGIVCMSVPNYWIGFMLMLAFAVNIPLFSIMGAENLIDFVLPALAIAIPTAAANIRVFRSSLLDGYNSDFVMYARARGISERKIAGIVSRYALPPLVTLLGFVPIVICSTMPVGLVQNIKLASRWTIGY